LHFGSAPLATSKLVARKGKRVVANPLRGFATTLFPLRAGRSLASMTRKTGKLNSPDSTVDRSRGYFFLAQSSDRAKRFKAAGADAAGKIPGTSFTNVIGSEILTLRQIATL